MFQAPEPNTDNPNVPEIKENDDGSSGKEKTVVLQHCTKVTF